MNEVIRAAADVQARRTLVIHPNDGVAVALVELAPASETARAALASLARGDDEPARVAREGLA